MSAGEPRFVHVQLAGEPCVERVLMSLRDPGMGRIVLYGEGGMGKTWAARRVLDAAEKESLFGVIIWVSLSARSTLQQVQQTILERLPIAGSDGGGRDDEEGEESPQVIMARRRMVLRGVLSEIKFLLVLDDMWLTEDDVLGAIGVPAHDPAVGSKVLVTTRTRRAQGTTLPHLLIEVAGLPSRESLGLFLEAAGEAAAAGSDESLRPLVHEVIDKCLGIPLAIVLAGGLLRANADPLAVETTLREASSVLGQGNLAVYRTVKLAYRLLPSDAARKLLLCCGLIDQRVGITIQDFIGYSDQMGEAMLTGLLNRRLLCKDGEGRIMMASVVKEVLLDIGNRSDILYLRTGTGTVFPPEGDVWRIHGMIALIDTKIAALPDSPCSPWLSTLFLNGNHLFTSIPDKFFAWMGCLQVLDLSDTEIQQLPSSLGELLELQILLLRRCTRLKEVANINSPKLQLLDLSETSVEELPSFPNLANLRQLLLSGCRRLRSAVHLSSLTKLELLDLSGTTLVEFPCGISGLTQLKRLRLVGSNYTRVEWKMIPWLPQGLQWDQSSGSDITTEPAEDGDGGAFISASDPVVFSTLDRDSPLWRNCFKKFLFTLCHPDASGAEVCIHKKGFAFRDAYLKTRHFVHSQRRDRYLELCGLHSFPHGIQGVLCNSDVVALNNINFLKRLSEFGLSDLKWIKECWIERCEQMETVLEEQEVEFLGAEGSLECLCVSNLVSLRCLFGKMGRTGSFACLKHLNLDCCPNLVCVFSSAVRLQNLETLQIKFCDELETVFGEPVSGEDALPRLHSMRLWELPQLRYISDGFLPALKNLKVKQCPVLNKIPVPTGDMSPPVLIIGESRWWNNLNWDDQAVKCHLLFRKWGRF